MKQEKDIGEFIRNFQQEGFIDTLSKESKGKLLKAIDDIFWTDKIGRTRVNNAARYWEFAKECPPPAVRRDEKFWIASSPADPVWDIDSLPMTYMDSRWSAFIIHIEEDSLQNILPPPLKPWDGERNNVAELWYVDHAKSAFGPHCKSGVAISAFYKDKRGNVWLGAYYPVMYINSEAPLSALSTIGCAVKQATIRCTCHEGPNRVTYSDKGNDYFSFGTCRNGYLIHTASGKFDDTPIMPPYFYGRSDWGKFSVKTVIAGVHDDQISYARNLWYLPSTIP
ncbi:MAG: acetoacetate decarboxylase family protein, partial [Candidatus Niyogibacteria bacterium]|nr:acetoacetate decarboxylase family protein [Candidatus Niyogibacteria bacterium]